MSNQAEAKAQQGYVPKFIPNTCGNCKHFISDVGHETDPYGRVYRIEHRLRCGIGGFAVKKMGSCTLWKSQ